MRKMLLAALLLLGASACILPESSPGVMLATDPPGARVLVNGVDTGFATPATLDLSAETSRVTLELEGYQTVSRELIEARRWHVVPWTHGDMNPQTWRFPFFLTFKGLFFPFRYRHNVYPKRIFIPLEVAVDD